MANLPNYHSHCSFCDGRAPLEDSIKSAINRGFTSYGISSHAPLPFSTHWTLEKTGVPAYLEEAYTLKEKYAGHIELYAGMEIDYLDEKSNYLYNNIYNINEKTYLVISLYGDTSYGKHPEPFAKSSFYGRPSAARNSCDGTSLRC